MDIRNIAIIAHVDHGKTTLIDGLFRQSGVFQSHQIVQERIMDSGELERERGITITAKNASFTWKGTRINIVDTPGHADFGGEVERALFMVDGALLLVDAAEGPLPQTRFVLRKALERNIKLALIINKVDRPDARIDVIEEKVFELFYELAAHDDQVNYKTLYASGRDGWASLEKGVKKENFQDLFEVIVNDLPPPRVQRDKPFQMIVTNRTFDSFVGQIAIGRIESGAVKNGQRVFLQGAKKTVPFPITSLSCFAGLGTERVEMLEAGNIALISGAEAPMIGDTISETQTLTPLPRLHVDPPTVAVKVSVNTSPLAGKEGKYLTSRRMEEVLQRACLANVALQMEPTATPEVFMLKARGELQVVILLEQMRREGYEFMAGRPEIIPVEIDGQQMEALETLVIDIPENMVGRMTEVLAKRGGKMEAMENLDVSGRIRLEFTIPARGLIGVRSTLLTESKGEAVFSSSFKEYMPYQGKRYSRKLGALVCDRPGASVEYGLFHLQSRGRLFIREGMQVYEGLIFGEHSRENNLICNPCREKKLTNMRAAGSDDSTKLKPIRDLTLDEAMEWIDEDEWVEITPQTLRLRKAELKTNVLGVIRE